jgi:glutathione S-transferase
MTATLYGMGYSPWTERARWALEHHRVPFEYREHTPLLGEIALRMKTRMTKPTVPLLIEDDRVVMGSDVIGRHADKVGRGDPLFPGEHDAAISRWIALAEKLAGAGRVWIMSRLPHRRDAQAEALPPFLPESVRNVLAPSAALGTSYIAKKYGVPSDAKAEVERTMRPALQELRDAIQRGTYLAPSGKFSFADIALAATVHVLRPHANAKMGPATRDVWTNEALAEEFADLIAWRDTMYEKHR